MKWQAILAGTLILCAALGVRAADGSTTTPSFDASFVQTRSLPGFGAPLVSHGFLRFDAAHGFRWEITAPYHYVFVMNGGQAHEELPDGSTRQLDPSQTPWLAAVEHIFISALSGNRSDLQQYFDVVTQHLSRGQRITLTPKPGPIAEAIISIQVTERAPGHPEQLEIRETSGGRMDIRFTPVAPAPATP